MRPVKPAPVTVSALLRDSVERCCKHSQGHSIRQISAVDEGRQCSVAQHICAEQVPRPLCGCRMLGGGRSSAALRLCHKAGAASARFYCALLMKSSVHCCSVSLGLVTLWPFVFGDTKISWSLPPCMQHCAVKHPRALASQRLHVQIPPDRCFLLCKFETYATVWRSSAALMQAAAASHTSRGRDRLQVGHAPQRSYHQRSGCR